MLKVELFYLLAWSTVLVIGVGGFFSMAFVLLEVIAENCKVKIGDKEY